MPRSRRPKRKSFIVDVGVLPSGDLVDTSADRKDLQRARCVACSIKLKVRDAWTGARSLPASDEAFFAHKASDSCSSDLVAEALVARLDPPDSYAELLQGHAQAEAFLGSIPAPYLGSMVDCLGCGKPTPYLIWSRPISGQPPPPISSILRVRARSTAGFQRWSVICVNCKHIQVHERRVREWDRHIRVVDDWLNSNPMGRFLVDIDRMTRPTNS